MVNSHQCNNYMGSVEVDGVLFDEEAEVKEQVVEFYHSLYQENEPWRPTVDGLQFAISGEENRNLLDHRFDKEEVIKVVQEIQGDTAPGPDASQMPFFKNVGVWWNMMFWHFSMRYLSMWSLRNLLMLLLLLSFPRNQMLLM